MSKTDKFTIVNSDNKQRYIELFSLMNEANHQSLKTKGKFKNLILTEQCCMLIVLVLMILYIAAYWRNWTPTFFIFMALMLIFECLAGFLTFKFIKQAKKLRSDLANQSEEITIQKTHIKISRKKPIFEEDIKKEDIRAIYITKYNVLILPHAHASNSPIYLDKSYLSEIRPALEEDYPELIKETK